MYYTYRRAVSRLLLSRLRYAGRVFKVATIAVCVWGGYSHAADNAGPRLIAYEVSETFPHRIDAFTQGLVVSDKGYLIESVGRYGKSALAILDLASGKVLRQRELPDKLFGEGTTVFDGFIYQLTWRAGIVRIYDRTTLMLRKTAKYYGEGWGLTHNGRHLLMSNGSSELIFRSADRFREVRRLTVTERGRPRDRLNELEWVDGTIFANVWQQCRIIAIDEDSGKVIAQLDIAPLCRGQRGVANGLAWRERFQDLLVTGKNWDKIFALKFDYLSL